MNTTTWTASIDARVLEALHAVPDEEPLERVAERAGVTMLGLRESMRRLALRTTEGPGGATRA